MKKNSRLVFSTLLLTTALLLGGCGSNQQAAETSPATAAETISENESLADEKASLEAEIEELRLEKEAELARKELEEKESQMLAEEESRREEESLKQEESLRQEEESRKAEEAANLSEMGKLGLQDEPFAYEGILINLPLEFLPPEGSVQFAHRELSLSPRIYFDNYSVSSWLPSQDSIRGNLKIYEGFEDFDSYEETEMGGANVFIYSYKSNSTSNDKIQTICYDFYFPDKAVIIKAAYAAEGDPEDIAMMENSMASIRVEGAEEQVDPSAGEAEGSGASSEEGVNTEGGSEEADLFESINLSDFDMEEEAFEYEGVSVHFPAGFNVTSRYENGTAQTVDADFSGSFFFHNMDVVLEPDLITEELVLDVYKDNNPDIEKLELFGRNNVNGLDVVYSVGKGITSFGNFDMYICYAYYCLEDKTVYLSFSTIKEELVKSFLATVKTSERA